MIVMEIDPLEIFTTGGMPKTYESLTNLDVHKKLAYDFASQLKAEDIMKLHTISKLEEIQRAEAVKDVIVDISTRQHNVSKASDGGLQSRRLKL
jgi:hypothetical protein